MAELTEAQRQHVSQCVTMAVGQITFALANSIETMITEMTVKMIENINSEPIKVLTPEPKQ